jgi:hypothetical protein
LGFPASSAWAAVTCSLHVKRIDTRHTLLFDHLAYLALRSRQLQWCDANTTLLLLLLCCRSAPFEFYDPASPIYTSPRFLPPAKIEEDCQVRKQLL